MKLLLFGFLLWNSYFAQAGSFFDRNVVEGRETFVHLFEWRWDDIAQECESFLGPNGYAAVQVSPPNEHAVIYENVVKQPWWQRYQPVSYKLVSRSGDQQNFEDMVKRCHKVGVRIYVDAVINHMTGGSVGKGSAGSPYDGNSENYPGVPYGPNDFNDRSKCKQPDMNMKDYDHDRNEFRNCRLVGLRDLDQGKEYVRQKIVEYMNHLISLGVAGFRIDAAKHMWPGDLKAMYNSLNNLNTDYFPENSKPYIFQEVIDHGDNLLNEYEGFAPVTEFKYGMFLKQAVKKTGQSMNKLWNFGVAWRGFAPSSNAVVFTDNHDSERDTACTGSVITSRDHRAYKIANTFGLAWPYGYPKILSGYKWDVQCDGHTDRNRWVGPPHYENYETAHVKISKDNTCTGRWTCTHRWRQIYQMVKFRNVVGQSNVKNWWSNGPNKIAFSRGNKGFVAINNDDDSLVHRFNTGLPEGDYCDVISGDFKDGICLGNIVHVDSSGYADLVLEGSSEDPMVAIHVQAKLDGKSPRVTKKPVVERTEVPYTITPSKSFKRTIIFVEKHTNFGQNLFLRGGLDPKTTTGCDKPLPENYCSIPIIHRTDTTIKTYTAWKKNDLFLDWNGPESRQGSLNGWKATGSPMVWTTFSKTNPNYNKMNKYGDAYWMLDVEMDCSRTNKGWFEAKAMLDNQWEPNIKQNSKCGGDLKEEPAISGSVNHVLKCGAINVVSFGKGSCITNKF